MKVLWICNVILPVIARHVGLEVVPTGGWLTGMSCSLSKTGRIKLVVCFGWKNEEQVHGETEGIEYISYKTTANNVENFKQIIKRIEPDVIHIWGTEGKHSLDMIEAAQELGVVDKTVINIQGLVSIACKYHYFCHLPIEVISSNRLVELRYGHRIKDDRKDDLRDAEHEIKALQLAKNVIGRTDWDEACTKQANPNLKYYRCNESLRDSFYEKGWSIENVEKHSIFVGMSYWPAKGLHIAIEALSIVKKQYDRAKLYVICESPLEWYKSKHFAIRQRSYPHYLAKLICDNNLEDSVVFLPKLNEQEMCERFLKSNVFVSASSIENSSNSIGEAMLLGMPVVASDVGGIKNFMEHEKEGYLYQSDAPYMLAYYICKVFENDNRAVEMGQRAREHALKSYDRENNLQTMLSIYDKIVNESSIEDN